MREIAAAGGSSSEFENNGNKIVKTSLKRRRLIAGLPALIGVSGLSGFATAALPPDSPLADIERRFGGRLGVYAVDIGSNRTLAHRDNERFLMCSTFKAPLVALVLSRVDAGNERLQRTVNYTRKDMIFTSPLTQANLARGQMTVGGLCQAAVEASDNTAAVLLMRSVGGPQALTRFMRGLRDDVTRSDRYEPDSNRYSGLLDTTTPRAIATSAARILLGDVLSRQSRRQLEDWMIASQPGLNRLRAALPADWLAGDRPGTSVDRQTNDFAIVRPPARAPLVVAAYYDAPGLDMARREAVVREVGHVFARWASGGA